MVSTESDARIEAGSSSLIQPLREKAFWLLLMIVAVGYLWRLPALPIHGEESRWARGAVMMLETGDYIVPRQQGKAFPERPPMNSWLMAGLGTIRGDVDVWAIRLPSVLAVVLTSLLLYGYCRQFLPQSGAFAAGAVYATFGQVMQIGRLGESEAILALFATAALLTWHTGYIRKWNPALTWSLAYSFAALAALTKGLQGPVYLIVVTCVYLAWHRNWKYLFSWQNVVGAIVGASIVALWQVPFWMATDLQSVKDVWTGLVMDRITIQGLLTHLVSYPLETIGCLMPWSLMAIQLLRKSFRRDLMRYKEPIKFAVLAFVIAYPSVWLVTGARGRYFMPLYGCIAVALAIIVQASLEGRLGSWAQRGWLRFARMTAIAFSAVSVVLVVLSLAPRISISNIDFQWLPSIALAIVSGCLCWFAFRSSSKDAAESAVPQLASIASCLALAYVAVAPSIALKHGHHVRDNAAEVSQLVEDGYHWVSFGPVHHRFIYHLNDSVEELDWPESSEQIPEDVDYFLLDYNVWDTPEQRLSGRGRTWGTTPGTLPFDWEEVMRVPMDRSYLESDSWVIVGRVIRPVPSSTDSIDRETNSTEQNAIVAEREESGISR